MSEVDEAFLKQTLDVYECLSQIGKNHNQIFQADTIGPSFVLKTDIPSPFFNFAVFLKEVDSSNMNDVLAYFSNIPFQCTFDKKQEGLTYLLEDLGFKMAEKSSGMLLKLDDFRPSLNLRPAEIIILPVSDEMTMNQWINVVSLSFRLSKYRLKEFFYPLFKFGGDRFRFNLCWYEGKPASAGLIFLNPPNASILFLATLQKFRNRGLGFFTLQEALIFAKPKTVRNIFVQSTVLGLSVYKKLGFNGFQDLYTYVSPS